MDPQKRFLASTLQGAIDADVVTKDDLYHHISAEVLAAHVPPEILWALLSEGMNRSGLGFGSTSGDTPTRAPDPAQAPAPAPAPAQAEAPAQAPAQAPASIAIPRPIAPAPAEAAQSDEAPPDFDDDDLDAAFDQATDGASSGDGLDIDMSDEEMPPIPDGEAVVVEDFDDDDH